GLAQATRFSRTWPMTLSLASAKTRNVLLSNLIRLLSLPIALVSWTLIGGLEGLALGFLAGEGLALFLALMALNRSIGRRLLGGSGLFSIAWIGFLMLPAAAFLFQLDRLEVGVFSVLVFVLCLAIMHWIDRKLVPRNFSAFGW
ncbi:MAG: hypothetical protein AAFO63_09175, partial [Pseudomonadota bacterium]